MRYGFTKSKDETHSSDGKPSSERHAGTGWWRQNLAEHAKTCRAPCSAGTVGGAHMQTWATNRPDCLIAVHRGHAHWYVFHCPGTHTVSFITEKETLDFKFFWNFQKLLKTGLLNTAIALLCIMAIFSGYTSFQFLSLPTAHTSEVFLIGRS